ASTTIGNGTQTGGLTVSGGATTTGNAYFAGNVGIGTNAPAAKLQVAGGAILLDNNQFLKGKDSGGTARSIIGTTFAGTDIFDIAPSDAYNVRIAAGGGNVSIGSSASPSYKLDVAGFINTDQYSGFKQNGNTVLYASTTNRSLALGASSAAGWISA